MQRYEKINFARGVFAGKLRTMRSMIANIEARTDISAADKALACDGLRENVVEYEAMLRDEHALEDWAS